MIHVLAAAARNIKNAAVNKYVVSGDILPGLLYSGCGLYKKIAQYVYQFLADSRYCMYSVKIFITVLSRLAAKPYVAAAYPVVHFYGD